MGGSVSKSPLFIKTSVMLELIPTLFRDDIISASYSCNGWSSFPWSLQLSC